MEKDTVEKHTTPTQAAIYISLEEGTPEYKAAEGFLKWAGKDGSTHVFSDRGEAGVFDEYIKRIGWMS